MIIAEALLTTDFKMMAIHAFGTSTIFSARTGGYLKN
jgi:hypothetical protein